MKTNFLLFLLLIQLPVNSTEYYSTFKANEKCYGNLHKEKYIKGDASNPGFVKNWSETKEISCKKHDGFDNQNQYLSHLKRIYKISFNWVKSKITDIKSKHSLSNDNLE